MTTNVGYQSSASKQLRIAGDADGQTKDA